MNATPLMAAATIIWVLAGVLAGRAIVHAASSPPPPSPAATTGPGIADGVAITGIAEQAAIAWARGEDQGTAQLLALPHRPAADLAARDGAHYVDRAAVVDLDGADDDWLALVRIDALRAHPDGYQPVGPVLVSVPITRRDGAWLLAGQPLIRPVDTASAGTAG